MRLSKHLMLAIVVMIMLLIPFGAAFAQDDQALTPAQLEELDRLAREAAAEEIAALNDLAFNLLGIFEAVSVAITIIGAGLGVIGFGRLISAEGNLNKAREEIEQEIVAIREQFNNDLEQRRQEFESFTTELTEAVEQQRREAVNATLATALLSFGERQYKASDYVGAVNTYKRSLELDNNNPVTYYRLGYVYTTQGDLDGAEEQFTKSLAIDDAFAPAIVALGHVYRRKGQKLEEGIEREMLFNQAEKQMLAGLKISPKLIDDDGESWWGSLGGLYRRRGQIKQAIYAYEQATTVTPHSSYPFGNLATLYGSERNTEAMLRMYKRVEKLARAEVQAEVDNFWGYFDLLTAQLALGHTAEAEDILPSVVETVPLNAAYAFDMLVETLERAGNYLEGYPQSNALFTFAKRIKQYAENRSNLTPGSALDLPPEDTSINFEIPKAEETEVPSSNPPEDS